MSPVAFGEVFQFAVHLAVATGQQEQQDFVRQILDIVLRRIPDLRIGLSAIFDGRIVAKDYAPRGEEQAAAAIPKGIDELGNRHARLYLETLGGLNRRTTGWMHVEEHHHGGRLRKTERHFVTDAD